MQHTGPPVSFGNDDVAAAALDTGVVVVDRSHWGRLRICGDDRLKFLHGQSTADFLSLQPGSGCRTVGLSASVGIILFLLPVSACLRRAWQRISGLLQVFVNRNGRTIDLATCLVQGSGITVIVSPSRRVMIRDRLEQYIFFGDKVSFGIRVGPTEHSTHPIACAPHDGQHVHVMRM